ncbi:MAG: Putative phosphatase, partial [uncultured Corynebacteriales bacterium]
RAGRPRRHRRQRADLPRRPAEPAGHRGGGQRLRLGRGDPLGRPGAAGRAAVRPHRADAGVAGRPVRLQQRLPRGAPAGPVREPGAAVVQPRVHQRGADVPRLHLAGRPHGRPGPDRHAGARRLGRGDRAGPRHRAVEGGAARPPVVQPADHRDDPDDLHRRRGRQAAAAHQRRPVRPARARHAEQLRRRRHPVGDDPDRRGELQPVLRRRRRGPGRGQAGAGPVRRLHHRALPERLPQVGAGRPALRPGGRAARGQPVRLHRRDRPVRPGLDAAQAHRPRPLQARGREHQGRQGRPGGGVHGRRRAVRLHLQVRLLPEDAPGPPPGRPRVEQAAARGRHPVRREVHRRLAAGRDRRQRPAAVGRRVRRVRAVDPADRRQAQLRARLHRRAGAGAHPAGRRHGRRDQDGPAGGHRAQPGQRQDLLRADEQHQPGDLDTGPAGRAGGGGGRGQPAAGEPQRPGPGDHRGPRRRRGHHLRLVAADRLRGPGGPLDVLRRLRQVEGQPHLLPGQRGLRPGRQPVARHRRQRAAPGRGGRGAQLQRRPVRDAAGRTGTRLPEAVRHRAARGGDLRAVHHRGPADRLHRRAAPRRGDRLHLGHPGLHLAGRQQAPAVGGVDLADRGGQQADRRL